MDAFPIQHEGQQFICLRDPEGVVDEQLLLTPPAFFIACHLDGTNGVADIQQAFSQHFGGHILPSHDINQVVTYLDEHGLLLTERFVARRQSIAAAFHQADVRPAYLAGKSYPDRPGQLRSFLDGFFLRADGPGEGPGSVRSAGTPARCLIAPHIDFHRGGHAYAHGYLQLVKQGQPDIVFIFGVAHAAPPVPFLLTKKHFATPFGVLQTDQNLVQRLESVCTWDPYAYEMVHRTEHSIEFQAVMLSYLYGTNVHIVPILCASFDPRGDAINPEELPDVTAFLDVCREVVAASPDRLSVIAGADLAHVGRRFGDSFEISDTVVQEVGARDHEDIQHVLAADAEGFYRSVMQDQNSRRVCGLTCIYAALKAVEGIVQRGALLHYDYAHDPAGGIVSFTNILFM